MTLNKAIEACITAIEEQKGKLVVKEGARAVSLVVFFYDELTEFATSITPFLWFPDFNVLQHF